VRLRGRHAYHEVLRHVVHSVRHFAERAFVSLIQESRSLGELRLSAGHVGLTTNRITIELTSAAHQAEPLTLTFDENDGWLAAGAADVPAWTGELDSAQRVALANALAGFFQMAGADLVHEQVRAALAPVSARYELVPRGIRAWLPGREEGAVLFDLRDGSVIAEERAASPTPELPGSPTLTAERLLLRQNPITWSVWVDAWERDQAGEPAPVLSAFEIAPTPSRVTVS
jgi:hypothetical protein